MQNRQRLLLFLVTFMAIFHSLAEPASKTNNIYLVSRVVKKDFLSETIRIGDLNGDGAPDVLFVQDLYGPRIITCLTATMLSGEILWQTGTPSKDNGRAYCDLPVQIYDWDQDGANEVLYVRQATYLDALALTAQTIRERAPRYEGAATMIVLDGRTGREKNHFPVPAPADDSFLFADLTGRGRRADLVVKDRYWNMWGVSHEAKVLWHYAGSVGHYPAIADVDEDGRDEVFVGFALIDHDGKVLFQNDAKGEHQDATFIVKPPDGKWRIAFGNGGIHCLDCQGQELWFRRLGEAQHVVAGHFRSDSPLQFMVVDRTPVPTHRRDANAWAILYLYDLEGRELWHRQMEKGEWCIGTRLIHWLEPGKRDCVLVYGFSVEKQGPPKPARIYDGQGQILDTLPLQVAPLPGETDFFPDCYGMAADLWGDSREEVLLFGARGFCVYANARPLERPSLYNMTLYPGQ
jgi:rhamnogalacturonan endolyase